jgi:predicted TIM-barrel fold metal-dependent hydrolase
MVSLPFDPSIYGEPKVDCHCHILDPDRFAYTPGLPYHPAGQETGSADYFAHVHAAYGVRHALLVQPNSGYSHDNRALLAAIAQHPARFKGIAVVPHDASVQQLQDLQAQGIVGAAFNTSLLGLDHYRNIGPLLRRLADVHMFANVQVERDQMVALAPMLVQSGVHILIDHCGRPDIGAGLGAPGFAALLALAASGRVSVKLSGFAKFSGNFPFADALAHVAALLQSFGPEHCLWASDWPFLKANSRLDYGPLLQLFAHAVPEATTRHQILWQTPIRLFDFGLRATTTADRPFTAPG